MDTYPSLASCGYQQADVEARAQSEQGGTTAPCSSRPEESKVESGEHQNDANVDHQPFPESVSEERKIDTDYYRCHCQHVKRDSDLPANFTSHGTYFRRTAGCLDTRLYSGEFRDKPMAHHGPEPPAANVSYGEPHQGSYWTVGDSIDRAKPEFALLWQTDLLRYSGAQCTAAVRAKIFSKIDRRQGGDVTLR